METFTGVARKLANQLDRLGRFGEIPLHICAFPGGMLVALAKAESDGTLWRRFALALAFKGRLKGLSMGGRIPAKNGYDDDENSSLPCVSPLHAIPSFEKVSQRKNYSRGSTLFVEGHAALGVFVLCAGRVKLSITSVDGRKVIVRIAKPGDMLGIDSVLTRNSYEATAETLADCRLDFISRDDLFELLDRQKSPGLNLAVAVSKTFSEFLEHARVLLLSFSASEKLARLLLRLSDEFGERTQAGTRLQTLLTHEEIGQMIGASRETVTRTLNSLKREQVIHAKNGEMIIRDRTALAELAKQSSQKVATTSTSIS